MKSIGTLLLLTTLAVPARAGVGSWTPLGPPGGDVTALRSHPDRPATVFAGTLRGGIFRSADRGETWAPISTGLAVGGGFPPISTFAFDARKPQRVYAATFSSGVFRSDDSGNTWVAASQGLPPGPNAGGIPVGALAADPSASGILYAGTTRGVYRSVDAGQSWAPRRTGLPDTAVDALGFDPTGGVLYAGLRGGGVYSSGNEGKRWVQTPGLLSVSIRCFGFDPRSPAVIYAGTTNGLYRSLNRGVKWVRLESFRLVQAIVGVGFLESNGYLYAANGTHVFESRDRGNTWSDSLQFPSGPAIQAFEIGADFLLTATVQTGERPTIWKAEANGRDWHHVGNGLSTQSVTSFAADPVTPSTLYAAADFDAFYRSVDAGASWQALSLAFGTFHLGTLAVDPHAPSHLYAAAPLEGPLVRSRDAGVTWEHRQDGSVQSADALALDPLHADALWIGGMSYLAYSPDGGDTFQPIAPAGEHPWVTDIEVDPLDPLRVFVAGYILQGDPRIPNTEARLYRSSDGGGSWQAIALPVEIGRTLRRVAPDPSHAGTIYAEGDQALFRSRDDGQSWQRIFTSGNTRTALLATAKRLYFSTASSGLQVSRDGGTTWTALRAGLGARTIIGLWIDPANPDHLYAGTDVGGLWQYTFPPGS